MVNRPLLHTMTPEEVETKLEKYEDHDEGWKRRNSVLAELYSSTTKEKKQCKRCGTFNSFFKIDCQKCRFKFQKTRSDRVVTGFSDRHSSGINPFGSSV